MSEKNQGPVITPPVQEQDARQVTAESKVQEVLASRDLDETTSGGVYQDADKKGFHNANGKPCDKDGKLLDQRDEDEAVGGDLIAAAEERGRQQSQDELEAARSEADDLRKQLEAAKRGQGNVGVPPGGVPPS